MQTRTSSAHVAADRNTIGFLRHRRDAIGRVKVVSLCADEDGECRRGDLFEDLQLAQTHERRVVLQNLRRYGATGLPVIAHLVLTTNAEAEGSALRER